MSRPVRLVPQAANPLDASHVCPLCGNIHAAYVFSKDRVRIYRCGGCALTFRSPDVRAASWPAQPPLIRADQQYEGILRRIEETRPTGPICLLARVDDPLVAVLRRRKPSISVIVEDDSLSQTPAVPFAVAVVTEHLMRTANPIVTLQNLRRRLADRADLFLTLPLLDSSQAKLMGRNWPGWNSDASCFFTRETLHLMLLKAGFHEVWFETEWRRYSLENLDRRLPPGAEGPWRPMLRAMRRIAPMALRKRPFRLPSGTAVVTAKAAPMKGSTKVSIIVPVFNERATVKELLDRLTATSLPEIEREIIIVESNSTDGSREIVESYRSLPEVKLILQPHARGKGYAVREGLAAARGDVILIQDADLEYDLNDYDGLLAPLMAWQSMFILGSRHTGNWKMRHFNDAPFTAALFNFGHRVFRSMLNLTLNTRMADPFTMFKLFRRDALFGLQFDCKRFDFDIELVMKLVRKGYMPLEIPVNYEARSFAEGKKVSFLRDGMTWVWTILKLRFLPIGPSRKS
jgi:hypothetical protein